jgi:hypothetical protein
MSHRFNLPALWTPTLVSRKRKLPLRAKVLYGAICGFWKVWKGKCPGLQTLAYWAGLSRRVATRALRELQAARLVAVFHSVNGAPLDIVPLELGEKPATTGEPVPRLPWGQVAATTGDPVSCTPCAQGDLRPRGNTPSENLTENENEKGAGLPPLILNLGRAIQERYGRKLSANELWKLAPAVLQWHVPPEFILEWAAEWNGDRPWQFAARCAERYRASRAVAAPAAQPPAVAPLPAVSPEEVARARAILGLASGVSVTRGDGKEATG